MAIPNVPLLQILNFFWLVLDEDFIPVIDGDHDGHSLVLCDLISPRREFHDDSKSSIRIEGINETEKTISPRTKK